MSKVLVFFFEKFISYVIVNKQYLERTVYTCCPNPTKRNIMNNLKLAATAMLFSFACLPAHGASLFNGVEFQYLTGDLDAELKTPGGPTINENNATDLDFYKVNFRQTFTDGPSPYGPLLYLGQERSEVQSLGLDTTRFGLGYTGSLVRTNSAIFDVYVEGGGLYTFVSDDSDYERFDLGWSAGAGARLQIPYQSFPIGLGANIEYQDLGKDEGVKIKAASATLNLEIGLGQHFFIGPEVAYKLTRINEGGSKVELDGVSYGARARITY